jgi:hypothetical protein
VLVDVMITGNGQEWRDFGSSIQCLVQLSQPFSSELILAAKCLGIPLAVGHIAAEDQEIRLELVLLSKNPDVGEEWSKYLGNFGFVLRMPEMGV